LDASEGGIVVLLDPDVNFPPEGFTFMLNTLRDASVVISTRRTYPSLWYFIVSKVYRWIFGRVLLIVNADIRAGIKMFRRSVLESLRFDPEFDLRFGFDAMLLYHAQRMGWLVDSVSMSYFRPMFRHGVWEAIRSRVILVPVSSSFASRIRGARFCHSSIRPHPSIISRPDSRTSTTTSF
jgi:hypothetical protein